MSSLLVAEYYVVTISVAAGGKKNESEITAWVRMEAKRGAVTQQNTCSSLSSS